MSEKRLTKAELNKTWFTWICWAQICYNYERMMGLGFCHTMSTAINKLYADNEEERKAALVRHMAYYNTENTWGAIVPGIVCSLEEARANGENVDPQAISNLKTALMGPLAGIGDTITQSLVKVILLGIGIDMAMAGNPLGPIIFIIGFSAYAGIVSYICFNSGYRYGKDAVVHLLSGGKVKRITESLNVIGMIVLGALVAKNIGVSTPLVFNVGQMTVTMQTLCDSIMPKLIPVIIFFVTFKLLQKNKPTKVMIILMVASAILSLLGILA